jgi:hypothetical protein
MKKITILSAFFAVSILLLTNGAFAQSNASASGQFSLQGMLTTNTGTPIADGSHSLTVNVYANGSSSAMFSETDNITTSGGVFTAMIGANGSGGTKLTTMPDVSYQLGISVDGGAELSPKLQLGSSLSSLTANLAANADAVGGFTVSTSGNANARANTLFTLNGTGKIDSSLLAGSLVTSVNGMSGAINLQGAGNLGVSTNGNTVTLTVGGSGGGSLTLPFTQTVSLSNGTAFSITNSLAGSAASFVNTGVGNALNLTAGAGSAISATSSGGLGGAATLNIANTGGAAINAVANTSTGSALTLQNTSSSAAANVMTALNASGSSILTLNGSGQEMITATAGPAITATTNASGDAALKLQNTSSSAGANLINALNSSGSAVLTLTGNGQATITAASGPAITATTSAAGDAALKVQNMSSNAGANLITALNSTGSAAFSVAGNGQTSINSTVGNALNVSTTAAGAAAIAINGGLKVTGGAVGTGTIASGYLTTTINNALVQANSIILITVSGAGSAAVPLQVASQANGQFTVSAITSLLGLTGAVNFNYLIINQ